MLAGVFYAAGWVLGNVLVYALARARLPGIDPAVRGYYVGQMGSTCPERPGPWSCGPASLAPRLPLSVGVLTSFYEVLTTMAGGALTAAVIFAFLAPSNSSGFNWDTIRSLFLLQASQEAAHDRNILVAVAILFFTPLLLVITPVLFNRLIRRLKRFAAFTGEAPRLKVMHLMMGLAITSGTWLTFGLSGWSMLCGVTAEPPPFELAAACRIAGYIALAYVAGFFILIVPSGLGVRDTSCFSAWFRS